MKQINLISYLLVITVLLASCGGNSKHISSPDGSLRIVFVLKDGVPFYSVEKSGKAVIEPSRMGFILKGKTDAGTKYRLLSENSSYYSGRWEQPWGECRFIQDSHSEMDIHLQAEGGSEVLMDIQFRAFNDGIGFRYSFPQQGNGDSVVILDELTQFTFPAEHEVWWIPVHSDNSYYESLYRKSRIGETETLNTPATFETAEGLFLALHEADLTDFASMTLKRTGSLQYSADLVPWSDGVKVYTRMPFTSPWRTLIVGEKPGDLITSTLMLNLNEPCKLEDISWIKPSKYIGIWWGMHLNKFTWGQGPKHGATTERVKQYMDFASENGFGGVLAEGWNPGWDGNWAEDGTKFRFAECYPDFDLTAVTAYGAEKGVGLIGHHETGGAVTNYENQMEDAFRMYQKYGVHAVKTGYVNKYLDGKEWHDSQYGVRHYRKVVEAAAKYQIMIDNHEPVKGTGLQRTFPNLMTQEGGRGQEYDAWSNDGGNPPSHTVTLPFTRMLAGPFDFTPGTFNFSYEAVKGTRVNTTLAKQLALYVVIFSPQQMASDLPENYAGNSAFKFIKDVPCNWAETRVLNAEIGKYVTIARKDRNSDDWYIGSITNEESRELEAELSFLDEGKEYKAEIYADGEGADYRRNPLPVSISEQAVNSKTVLKLKLAAGGGTAIRISPR